MSSAHPTLNEFQKVGTPNSDRGTKLPCELINAVQLAELLGVSERTLYRLKSTGQLPAPIQLGGSVRWRLTEIRAWIAEGCPKAGACNYETKPNFRFAGDR